MMAPLRVWAHYSPGELSWCPDCRRISNSVQQCHACGATCGLVGVVELMDRQAQEPPRNKQQERLDAAVGFWG